MNHSAGVDNRLNSVPDNPKRPVEWLPYGLVILLSLFLYLCFSTGAFSMEPPFPGEVAQYRLDGSFARRLAFANALRNNTFHPGLVRSKIERLGHEPQRQFPGAQVKFPYATGLPTSGMPRMFMLLVDFPGLAHETDVSTFESKVFGEGDPEQYPYESLTQYYTRSSYGNCIIQGDVLGWYTADRRRRTYARRRQNSFNLNGVKRLIKEALTHYDQTHDFSQYDNDGDGVIDYFAVIWTGPDTGWGSIWWGWCDSYGQLFANDSFSLDGKTLGVFSWQWEKNERQNHPEFSPQTLIHETGHALGLPDYYDYDERQGPDGGVGGMDIMDGNEFDHNCFSKWMLDWLTPSSVTSGAYALTLNPSSTTRDCVAIMPGQGDIDPFSEYFLVQYRDTGGNDASLPNQGFLIWHVDAQINAEGDNFAYENSYAEHKLLRLMEADGKEDIENLPAQESYFDPDDFYVTGGEFSPSSSPNSHSYAGTETGVRVMNMSQNTTANTMSADFAIGQYSSTETTVPGASNTTTTVSGGSSKYCGPGTDFPDSPVECLDYRNSKYWCCPESQPVCGEGESYGECLSADGAATTTSVTGGESSSSTTTTVSGEDSQYCGPGTDYPNEPVACLNYDKGEYWCCSEDYPICGEGDYYGQCLAVAGSSSTTTSMSVVSSTTTSISQYCGPGTDYPDDPVECIDEYVGVYWCCPADYPICGEGEYFGYCIKP